LAARKGNLAAIGVLPYIGRSKTNPYSADDNDLVSAMKWFYIAKALGDVGIYNSRDSVGKYLTDEEVARAESLAEDWLEINGFSEGTRD
jgi:hypothetical protein